MRIAELAGQRVAIWGCGREGKAALTALRSRLPQLRMTVFCSEAEAAELEEEASRLKPLPRSETYAGASAFSRDALTLITTPPGAAALSALDVVIKSPGISAYKPEILEAQHNGTRFTSGTALWFAEHPEARVIAVTGTKGKSTTCAMIAHIARSLGIRTALAGNIGLPLLQLLGAEAALWVIELSSFQTGDAGPIEIGVINNLHEEHLDWHGSRERYAVDKLRLADAARTLVVNATNSDLLRRTVGHPHRIAFGGEDGWHVRDGDLYRDDAIIDPGLSALHIRGSHNGLNACAALTALDHCLEFDAERALDAAHSLADFRGLPHRLQVIGERSGCIFIDDSISTTPEATLAGLRSVMGGGGVVVIVGGHDRGLDWSGFAQTVASWAFLDVIAQGANGPRIAAVLRAARVQCVVREATDLADAVKLALALHAHVVLLSPGAPSFDQFGDYAERGREFARLVGFDPRLIGSIQGMGIA